MKIISVNTFDGTITYEIEYPGGVLREQLSISDYPTSEQILARISEREGNVKREVSARPAIPEDIRAMAEIEIRG